MYILVSIILVIIGLLLIGAVLVQPGKGDMMTGMTGIGSQFNSVLGSRRASDMLAKITWTLAGAIVVLTLITNLFFLSNDSGSQLKAPTEGMSIPAPMTQPAPAAAPQQAPATPQPASQGQTK